MENGDEKKKNRKREVKVTCELRLKDATEVVKRLKKGEEEEEECFIFREIRDCG